MREPTWRDRTRAWAVYLRQAAAPELLGSSETRVPSMRAMSCVLSERMGDRKSVPALFQAPKDPFS